MSSTQSGGQTWYKWAAVGVLVPLLTTVAGGLMVEHLKPNRREGGTVPAGELSQASQTRKASQSSPLPPTASTSGPDAWQGHHWQQLSEKGKPVEDYLIPVGDGKIINRIQYTDGKISTAIFLASAAKDGSLVPDDPSSTCERVRFGSMSGKELVLVWHYKSRPGIIAPYPAYSENHTYKFYDPVERAKEAEAVGRAMTLIFATFFAGCGFFATRWHARAQSEGIKGAVGCVAILLWIIAGLMLLFAILSIVFR